MRRRSEGGRAIGRVSERIERWTGGGDKGYGAEFARAYDEGLRDLWRRDTNELGKILLCRAENKLESTTRLVQELNQAKAFPANKLGYQDYKGMVELREAVSRYANRHICKSARMEPEDLMVSAGCGVVLENCFFCFCDYGDACLVPAPYYGQFGRDLGMRAGVEIVKVHPSSASADRFGKLSVEDLQAAYTPKCKVLLLTNPHNPLGIVHSKADLIAVLRWAQSLDLHVISDEIYACSVYKNKDDFVSLADLVSELELPDEHWVQTHCHTVFGFSKDFGASGLRIGALHSKNSAIVHAWNALGYSCAISSSCQWDFAAVLGKDEFVADFLAENARCLAQASEKLTSALQQAGIPFVGEPSAGLFLFIDLRGLLEDNSFDAERKLWSRLVSRGVVLNPGQSCGMKTPGYFRLCFAWMSGKFGRPSECCHCKSPITDSFPSYFRLRPILPAGRRRAHRFSSLTQRWFGFF